MKNKPAPGTPAHYEMLGIPDERLEATRLPSRIGNKLIYPRAYYDHLAYQEEKARKKAQQEAAQKQGTSHQLVWDERFPAAA